MEGSQVYTSAAPTLYPQFERFLDGGLIANNPTMDTLTEIVQFKDAVKRKVLSLFSICLLKTLIFIQIVLN